MTKQVELENVEAANGVETVAETAEVAKVEKAPKKEKKPSLTNVIVKAPEGTVEKFSGKSKVIAEKLLAGMSKSEILQELKKVEEAEGPVAGRKAITHQAIYQVYKRLINLEGVELGQKELVRAAAAPKAKKEEEAVTETKTTGTASDELAGVVEEVAPEEEEEVAEV